MKRATWPCLFGGLILGASLVLGGDPTAPAVFRAAASQPTSRPSIDEELVKQLLGGQTSAVDTVEAALTHMRRAAARLGDDLDPGERTQSMQKEALADLDKLIQQAGGSKAL